VLKTPRCTHTHTKTAYYEMLHRASNLDGLFGTTWATEYRREIRLHGSGVCGAHDMRNVFKILVGKPEGKRNSVGIHLA
jgi:hypothetical protein